MVLLLLPGGQLAVAHDVDGEHHPVPRGEDLGCRGLLGRNRLQVQTAHEVGPIGPEPEQGADEPLVQLLAHGRLLACDSAVPASVCGLRPAIALTGARSPWPLRRASRAIGCVRGSCGTSLLSGRTLTPQVDLGVSVGAQQVTAAALKLATNALLAKVP